MALDQVESCPVEHALRLLSGKWRLMVIFNLLKGPKRFGEIQKLLAPITQKVLTAALRGLEADGLVWRRVEAVVPPRVTYGLTDQAMALAPVFDALARWRLAATGDPRSLSDLAAIG